MLTAEHPQERLDSQSELRLAINNKELRSLLEDERMRTATLNEKLIELEQLNQGIEVVLDKIRQDPLAVLPPAHRSLLPSTRTIEQLGVSFMLPYDELLCSSQEMKAENEELQQRLSDLEEQAAVEQRRRAELQEQLDRAHHEYKELEAELGQERSERGQAILDAVDAECDRFNREIEQLAATYEGNERILQNNLRMLEETSNEKQQLALREKDRLLSQLERLQAEVDSILRQLSMEQKRTAEKELEVERLSQLLFSHEEKSALAENTFNDVLEKKKEEIETLRSQLVSKEDDFEELEHEQPTTSDSPSERFDDVALNHQEGYHLLLDQNRRLKETIAHQQRLQDERPGLAKVKSTESLNIFKELEAGQFVQDTFKFHRQDSHDRASIEQKQEEKETVARQLPLIERLRDSIGSAERQNEKMIARYEEVVSENTRVMNMYLKEQEQRIVLNKEKQELEISLTHTSNELQRAKDELGRIAKSHQHQLDSLKSKLLRTEEDLRHRDQELAVAKSAKTTRSKLRVKDDIDALPPHSQTSTTNLLTEGYCESQLSPRDKELIRLRRQLDQITYEFNRQKNTNVMVKETWYAEIERLVRSTVEAKEQYWQMQESLENLTAEHQELRERCRAKGIIC